MRREIERFHHRQFWSKTRNRQRNLIFSFFSVCNSQTCSLTQIFLLICSLFSCGQVVVDGCGKDRLESRSEVEDSKKRKKAAFDETTNIIVDW